MTQSALLAVSDLTVAFGDGPPAVDGIAFQIAAGETLAIVGESGSGKSVTALALMGLVQHEGGRIRSGRAEFIRRDGTSIDLLKAPTATLRAVRGNEIAMIFQEPMTSLNPVFTIGDQIAEALRLHRGLSPRNAAAAALDLIDEVRLSDPVRRFRQYPHELSGGMRQRVMIAMALACRPRILIADEPTTALDVTIQAEILDLIRGLQAAHDMAVVFITHDMGVVAEIADRIVVMRRGRVEETAPVADLFAQPKAEYTRKLLAAVPRLGSGSPRSGTGTSSNVLEVERLSTRFPVRRGFLRRLAAEIHAVSDVSLSIREGECLGLVGESGSGKSTLGRSILKLVEPTEGTVRIAGTDVSRLSPGAMRSVRRHVQMVFQDPFASLNPRLSALELVTEPLAIHTAMPARERRNVAVALLERVGLAADHLTRYPHQFSGGQRQRLCIARALSVKPKLIVADEPVSALDVSVQAQVLELLTRLREEDGLAFLFISHDLAVVERLCHRVAVMRAGRIVEVGPTASVLGSPGHDYTRHLLAAVPVPDPARRGIHRVRQPISVPSVLHPPGHRVPPTRTTQVGVHHWVAAD